MSRKFLITIVLILFLLPFVSWYYLQSGLEWRKEAQEVMNGTSPFPDGSFIDGDGDLLDADSLSYRVSLLSFSSCETSDASRKEVLESIYNQFKDTGKANFILLDTCPGTLDATLKSERDKWYAISCQSSGSLCKELLKEWPADRAFALVDRSGIIRSYYGITTEDDKRMLVEHMSLLLPRERQEKVELKRGEKK